MTVAAIDSILRLPDVERVTGYKRSHIYNLERSGHFPKRVALGLRTVGWRQSDISAWIEGLPQKAA